MKGGLGGIVLSWVASPLISGIIGILIYCSTDYFLLRSSKPVEYPLRAVPLMVSKYKGVVG